MLQVFPKPGSSRWHQTLEAALILRFHWDRVYLEGRDGLAAGVQHLESRSDNQSMKRSTGSTASTGASFHLSLCAPVSVFKARCWPLLCTEGHSMLSNHLLNPESLSKQWHIHQRVKSVTTTYDYHSKKLYKTVDLHSISTLWYSCATDLIWKCYRNECVGLNFISVPVVKQRTLRIQIHFISLMLIFYFYECFHLFTVPFIHLFRYCFKWLTKTVRLSLNAPQWNNS